MTKGFFDGGFFFASPGGRVCNPPQKNRLRRAMSKPTPGETPTPSSLLAQPGIQFVIQNFAALRAGGNVSGFRVKPGMTKGFFDGGFFFASPGGCSQSAAKKQIPPGEAKADARRNPNTPSFRA
jgi:hypothetical protein